MDEYRVATILNSPGGDPARLLIFDTEQGEQITGSVETSFLLPTNTLRSSWFFWSEPCGHIPSPDELVSAPFYPDLSQRIFALTLLPLGPCYAFNTEELLRFAQERVNQNIEWREWRTHAIELVVGHHIHRWISGCRLFAIVPHGRGGEDTSLQIFDFSHACRAKNLLEPDGTRSNMRRVLPNPTGYELPCAVLDVRGVTTGHDSILFCVVSILSAVPTGPRLNYKLFILYPSGAGNVRRTSRTCDGRTACVESLIVISPTVVVRAGRGNLGVRIFLYTSAVGRTRLQLAFVGNELCDSLGLKVDCIAAKGISVSDRDISPASRKSIRTIFCTRPHHQPRKVDGLPTERQSLRFISFYRNGTHLPIEPTV